MRLVSSYALPVLEKMALVIRARAPDDPEFHSASKVLIFIKDHSSISVS
jgi:hypothetical protein